MKHFFSALVVAVFCFFALASRVNKIHTGAFNTKAVPDKAKETYIVLNDGSHISGEEISTTGGLLRKEQIKIDGNKYMKKETKGYMEKGRYYIRQGDSYMERFITGKINLYYHEVWVNSTPNSNGFSRSQLRTYFYYQHGDDGKLVQLGDQRDIRKAVAGCDAAVAMADKSNGKMRRALRKDRDYLNSIFTLYNNGCK